LIGYWLDRWFDTWPVLFLIFFFLGAAAGMLNAYRYIRRLSDVPEERKNG
jgi:ATP synthase protein I